MPKLLLLQSQANSLGKPLAEGILKARSRLPRYSVKARRPSGVASTHVRGFLSRNSLVVLTYPASCSLRRWMVRLPGQRKARH